MSTCRPALAALTLALCLGVACTPSSSAARQPSTGAEPAPEPRDGNPVPSPAVSDVTGDPAPESCTPPAPPSRPVNIARPISVPRPGGPYRVRIVDADGRDLPTYWHEGRTYVMGTVGARYSIMVSNPTSRRVEAVVSVDGLDAVDGHTASYIDHRGYILQPYGSATIDGFRTSLAEVATFRFSSVADSYAGRLGQARDVGVIGVAFFPEREPVVAQLPPPRPYEYPPPSLLPAESRLGPPREAGGRRIPG